MYICGGRSHWCLFLLGQDGVVRFEAVFFEQRLAVPDLHVKQGISHAEERVGWGRHFFGIGGTVERGCELWYDCEMFI